MFNYSSPIDFAWKALLAEFIGTFAFVFVLASAVTVAQTGTEALSGTVLAALGGTFGLIAVFYLFEWFSGAHFNPATSLAMWITGRMKFFHLLGYVVVQLLAAIAAAALVNYIFDGIGSGNGVGSLTNVDNWKAVLVEATLTFIFVSVVLFVTSSAIMASMSGMAVGIALGAMMLSGYGLTGASMNPARSLGTGIFSNNLGSYWIYVVGPLIGSILAGLVYRLFFSDFSCCTKKDECGNDVLDSCGNPIKVCKRPRINECGKIVKDECGNDVMEEYHKKEVHINHMQQTPLGLFNEVLSRYGYSPVHYLQKMDNAADKIEHAHGGEAKLEEASIAINEVIEEKIDNFKPMNLSSAFGIKV